ncbi:MAG: DUF3419 family protein [Bacilli bacterium]|nr:DUF3419 family protein [Bacilli bacterium]
MTISEQRRKDLENAINLYDIQKNDQVKALDFSAYNKFYKMTNENLLQAYKTVEASSSTKALTILASGDQAFNLINKGVINVDCFDVNRLTEYYALGFKKRAIECLTYKQFIDLFSAPKNYQEIESYVIENMDDIYKWFWSEYKFRLKEQGYSSSIFDLSIVVKKHICQQDINSYLASEKDFLEFKQKLANTNINFYNANVKDLPEKFGLYDLIYLSNVFDYYDDILYPEYPNGMALRKTIELIKQIFEMNLTKHGEMIFSHFDDFFVKQLFLEQIINSQKKTYYTSAYFPHVRGLKKEK